MQSTCPPVNDNLMELLMMIDALKRGSASAITAVVPYYGYSKQDKKKSGREPISAKLVADLLEKAGIKRLVTIDLHAPQIEGFFDVPVDNMPATSLFANHLMKKKLKDIVVVSPDAGGMKRARDLANAIRAERIAVIDKYRSSYKSASAMNVVGKVKGMNAIIMDDFIDTGGSINEAVTALKNHGAKSVKVVCTHPLMTPPATERLRGAGIEEFITTDTVPMPKEKQIKNTTVISTAEMLGDMINGIMGKQSLHKYWAHQK